MDSSHAHKLHPIPLVSLFFENNDLREASTVSYDENEHHNKPEGQCHVDQQAEGCATLHQQQQHHHQCHEDPLPPSPIQNETIMYADVNVHNDTVHHPYQTRRDDVREGLFAKLFRGNGEQGSRSHGRSHSHHHLQHRITHMGPLEGDPPVIPPSSASSTSSFLLFGCFLLHTSGGGAGCIGRDPGRSNEQQMVAQEVQLKPEPVHTELDGTIGNDPRKEMPTQETGSGSRRVNKNRTKKDAPPPCRAVGHDVSSPASRSSGR
jgi:hypothetical protein